MEDSPRYWALDPNSTTLEDLYRSAPSLVPIVDEEEGGIIGYAMPGLESDILNGLNR